MPSFSARSTASLATCHPNLIRLFNRVVVDFDCSILEGHRSDEDQEKAYQQGRSKLRAGESKHNKLPSQAVDVAPYPIDWEDRARFYHFAGFVRGIASQMNIRIRCGCDWDGDFRFDDQSFHDLPHFELMI